MNRDEKSAAIEEIAAQIEGAEAIFAVDYRGISVAQAAELRAKLREADASFRVVKNRLTKLAADKAGRGAARRAAPGPDRADLRPRRHRRRRRRRSRPSTKSTTSSPSRAASWTNSLLDEDKFKSIARLPSREVLDGQLAGVVASPLTGLVRGLGSMIQGLALQLGQIAEKGLVTGEAPARPAADPVAEEARRLAETAGEEPPRTTPEAKRRSRPPRRRPGRSRPTPIRRERRVCGRGGRGCADADEADADDFGRRRRFRRLQRLTKRRRSKWQPKSKPRIGSRS